jgi:two-component system sensor histidine kinase/response regulator
VAAGLEQQQHVFLSTLPADKAKHLLAFAVIGVLCAAFLATAPFARVPLGRVDAFVPAYEAALFLNDLITAVLLFGQFALLRSRALLVLACGYLFTALIVIPHALTFPGLFAPAGLLGAGTQSTAWLYMFWHAGFPLTVIGYALLKHDGNGRMRMSAPVAIAAGVLIVSAVVGSFSVLATYGHALLPPVMDGNGYTSAMVAVVTTVWALSLAALIVLWQRRPHAVLDIWLMVVMITWLFDVALSAVLNAGRFDVGFYFGRIYGFLASSFILLVLLLETTAIYGKLSRSIAAERHERERRFNEMQAILAHLSRVNELGQMVSALSHEVSQPLTAVSSYLSVLGRLAKTNSDMVEPTVQKAIEQTTRATDIIRHLREFVAKRETDKKPENLPATIAQAMRLAMVGSRGAGVATAMEFDARGSIAQIDRIQVEQVLFNLIRNAVEAMADSPRRELIITTKLAPKEMIEVRVADTGPGLPESVRAKLFEPFVTTKATGMGVGLSICRVIIESHGGTLTAGDNIDGGTVFRFTLPIGELTSVDRAAG